MIVRLQVKAGYTLITTIILLALVLAISHAPVPQDSDYHLFADNRTIWQIPNFWNVMSNLPYLLVGVLGLYKLVFTSDMKVPADFRYAYVVFFAGIALIALGSGYYHLAPDNSTLVWDRLPMTIAFMSLFAIMLAEFISLKTGRLLLIPLLLAGVASVLYWYKGELHGTGDLRFYALVQFTPMLLMPVLLCCFRGRYAPAYGYWWLFIAYAIAKLCEQYDTNVYALSGFISGHSLKHIISALGVYALLVSFQKRRQLAEYSEHGKPGTVRLQIEL